jgi:hypothetical protein
MDNTELRYLVRSYLAARASTALSAYAITLSLRLKVGDDLSEGDVLNQLMYWEGLQEPQIKELRQAHGSQKYYQITSAGVLAVERGE